VRAAVKANIVGLGPIISQETCLAFSGPNHFWARKSAAWLGILGTV